MPLHAPHHSHCLFPGQARAKLGHSTAPFPIALMPLSPLYPEHARTHAHTCMHARTLRSLASTSSCPSTVPWLKLSRARFMPSATSRDRTSSDEDAGPRVTPILVLRTGAAESTSILKSMTVDLPCGGGVGCGNNGGVVRGAEYSA